MAGSISAVTRGGACRVTAPLVIPLANPITMADGAAAALESSHSIGRCPSKSCVGRSARDDASSLPSIDIQTLPFDR